VTKPLRKIKKLPWFVYILRCSDGSFYTGITNNLKNRVQKHNTGKGAKYTRTHGPVKLIYKELAGTNGTALKRERKIKGWPRKKKKALIAGRLRERITKN
jgi:predicted GIY-YIG superfamily endonuclease